MTKFIVLVALVLFRIFYHPSPANGAPSSFSNPVSVAENIALKAEARVISASANLMGNKIMIYWAVSENESADMFEIEKSTDGKNFKMAALVFGTDKPDTDNYQFYEKAGNQKWVYRIKLINKDKSAEYSPLFSPGPDA